MTINEKDLTNIEPANEFRFFNATDESEVLRLDNAGFHYKGETINDAGEAYKLFMAWLKKALETDR